MYFCLKVIYLINTSIFILFIFIFIPLFCFQLFKKSPINLKIKNLSFSRAPQGFRKTFSLWLRGLGCFSEWSWHCHSILINLQFLMYFGSPTNKIIQGWQKAGQYEYWPGRWLKSVLSGHYCSIGGQLSRLNHLSICSVLLLNRAQLFKASLA